MSIVSPPRKALPRECSERRARPTHILGLVLPVVGPEDGAHLSELDAVKEERRIPHRNVVRIEHQHLVEPFRRFDQRGPFQVERLGPSASGFVERRETRDLGVEGGEFGEVGFGGGFGGKVEDEGGEGRVVRVAEEAERDENAVKGVLPD